MRIKEKHILDQEIADIIEAEEKRQQEEICLIASENLPSPQVMDVCGSILMAKYSEGYPNHRYYGGCVNIDQIEQLAIDRACELFGAEFANVQSPSGSHANMCAYAALLEKGDTILAPSLQSFGHLTHSSSASFVSKLYNVVTYDVDPNTYMYDYDKINLIAQEIQPKLIIAGTSAYSRLIDYEALRDIADSVGAYLMADMAHIAGLVAAKVIPSPVPWCDVVTTTTHKTLRGCRGGLILSKKEFGKAINHAVFPEHSGGALQNMIAGKAICFKEAMSDEFKIYQQNIVNNARYLANYLMSVGNIDVLSGGTENHLFMINLNNLGLTGNIVEKALESIGIAVNKNMIPFDTEKASVTSGIRIGTASVTSRGMSTKEMEEIGGIIIDVLRELQQNGRISAEKQAEIRNKVLILTSRFPIDI